MNVFYGGHPDSGAYAELHKNVDLDELSPWEKLVIEEYQGRVEYMQHATEENLKSKIQVLHQVQDKERKKKKPAS
jgi:hypothetical protein